VFFLFICVVVIFILFVEFVLGLEMHFFCLILVFGTCFENFYAYIFVWN